MKKHLKSLSTFIIAGLFALPMQAQAQSNLSEPMSSQKAKVLQRIGLTDMKVVYHSPLVKGRDVWGKLVPYDKVWRAGANENTVFYTSTDIMVEGNKLPAGTYGLHMIPGKDQWTVIFSSQHKAWGSYTYDESEDALRVTVTPKKAAHQEWLSYQFNNPTPESTVLALRWEKTEVPVSVTVDVAETVYARMKDELRGLPGFYWESHYQVAKHCFNHKIHNEAAMASLEKSISIKPTFSNLNLKSEMLAAGGNKEKAGRYREKAYAVADEQQLNKYGYELMGDNRMDEALTIFKMNVKRYPKSWNVYDSLGEAYFNNGEKDNALSQYKKALGMAPEGQHKRINHMISQVENMDTTKSLSQE